MTLRWLQPLFAPHAPQAAARLGFVRGFASYLSAIDPRTEVPPLRLFPYRNKRATPYLYTDQDIDRILATARDLQSAKNLRGPTYATLFGLLAVTGMRLSEALALHTEDMDFAERRLTIRLTKFRKSRINPLHPSTIKALRRYAARREALHTKPATTHFFLSDKGTPLPATTARWNFVQVCRQIGLRQPQQSIRPRLHDFRHRFAVQTLLDWYRAGLDVEQRLPTLSTYLGHSHVSHTYWYLSAVPELLALSAQRLEKRLEDL
jgi:integrase